MSANHRSDIAHLETSAFAAAKVLPISVVRMRGDVGDLALEQFGGSDPEVAGTARRTWCAGSTAKAATARSRKASTSTGVMVGNSFSVFPVAGLVVAKGMASLTAQGGGRAVATTRPPRWVIPKSPVMMVAAGSENPD